MTQTTVNCIKMDGTGNDFLIFDCRADSSTRPSREDAPALCARDNAHTEGSDGIVIIDKSPVADCHMTIINRDGSLSSACGNATRCVGYIIAKECGKSNVTISTDATSDIPLSCVVDVDAREVDVYMGLPRTGWEDIPLAREVDTNALPFSYDGLSAPVAVNMGNPHVVFFTEGAPEDVPLEGIAPEVMGDVLLPQQANIGVAQVGGGVIKLRVYERGVGETNSCGTGACAAVVAAARRGLLHSDKQGYYSAEVHLPGGVLHIRYHTQHGVRMRGAVSDIYEVSDV